MKVVELVLEFVSKHRVLLFTLIPVILVSVWLYYYTELWVLLLFLLFVWLIYFYYFYSENHYFSSILPDSDSPSSGSAEGSDPSPAPLQCSSPAGCVVADTHLARRRLRTCQKQPLQTSSIIPKATRTRHSCSVPWKLFLVAILTVLVGVVLKCSVDWHGYLCQHFCVQAKPEDTRLPTVLNLMDGQEFGLRKKCKKLDRTDRDAFSEHLLLNNLNFSVQADGYCITPGVYSLDLVKELAKHSYWKKVATLVGLNVDISECYRKTTDENIRSSCKLLTETYNKGHNWNNYVEILRAVGLNTIADDLVSILNCRSIPMNQEQAVNLTLLYSITCEKDGTRMYFSLEEQVAPHWKLLANAFHIEKSSLSSEGVNSSSMVLRRLHCDGYKEQFGWQGVLDVLKDIQAKDLWKTLNQALDCVC